MFKLARSLFARATQSSTRSGRPSRRRGLRNLRPERLEQRLAPAVYRVMTAGDDTNTVASGGSGTAADPFLMNTLRGAVLATNATVGVADEIRFDLALNGTPIMLTLAGEDDACLLGDLDITDDLTIIGRGSDLTIIQAGTNANNGIDKVFGINPGGLDDIDVSLTGLTVRFGRNTTNPSENNQDAGGGIDFLAGGAGASSSSLNLADCVITQNTTAFDTETFGHEGGGVSIREALNATGLVTISNTTISNNRSVGRGGGIAVIGNNLQVSISSSAITLNSTLTFGGVNIDGGGLFVLAGSGLPPTEAFLTIDDTLVSRNTAAGWGGGATISAVSAQTFAISNSVIRDNDSDGDGAGVSSRGGGLYTELLAGASATLTNVLIDDNDALMGAEADGGGVYNAQGTLALRNCTIANNEADRDGGGLFNDADATTTLANVTVILNRANSDNIATGAGGGIRAIDGGNVTLENTLLAHNRKGLDPSPSSPSNIEGFFTARYCLIADTTGVGAFDGTSNLLNVDPGVEILLDNGGPTVGPTGSAVVLQTCGLIPGSPALDAGNNFLIPPGITTDQRGAGFVRVLDAADSNLTRTVDIGAFEAQIMLENIPDQFIDEDGSLVLSFQLGDADVSLASFTVFSNDVAFVPNLPANLSLGGSGATRTLTVKPLTDVFGNVLIRIDAWRLTVNGTAEWVTSGFTLAIHAVGDVPTVTSGVTLEGTQTGLLPITPNPIDGASVTHFKISNITNGTLYQANGTTQIGDGDFITAAQGAAGVRFTPAAGLTSASTAFRFDVQAAVAVSDFGLSEAVTASVSVSGLAGTWFINGQSTYILQDGNTLRFINERDETAGGFVVDADTVQASGSWGMAGELSFNAITWANGTLWTRTDVPPAPVIPSDFRVGGLHAHIEQHGAEVLFTNERGEVSRGRFISDVQIVATEWGDLVGTLVNGNTEVDWANGSTWSAAPGEAAFNISGTYLIDGVIAHIKQDGRALTLVNERGEVSSAMLSLDDTTITVDAWPVTGTVVVGGINWSNHTAWTETPFTIPALSHVWTINGRPTQLDYNNGELLLTSERGNLSRAVWLSDTQIFAVHWGLVGTLTNGNTLLNWENGTAWNASPSIVDGFFADDPDPFS